MKVQEALKAAVEAMETCKSHRYEGREANVFSQWFDEKLIAKSLDECKSALSEIEKCEPVAEALHERNRLGYAVVDVIGTLDEIIENAQEVEVDDFLHIAIPIDKWHELQDALEEMPKRAELYTSPISKEAYDGAREDLAIWKKRALEAEKKVTLYDQRIVDIGVIAMTPISKEWVDVPYEERRELYKSVSKGNIDGFADLLSAKLKQLNFPEKG